MVIANSLSPGGLRLNRRRALQFLGASATAALGFPGLTGNAGAATTVNVLVWQGYENPDAFKSLPDVTLQAAYLAANEDTITKTGTAGAFDLLTIYQGMIDPLLKTSRIEPIDTGRVPNLADLFPVFANHPALSRNGQLYGVPYTWGTMMVLYDSDKTAEPKSFDDLMKPELAGKVAMPDDAYAVITTFARYAGIADANRLTKDQLGQVMQLLNKFRPQLLSIAPSYGELPAMFGRGEILVSLPDWTPTLMGANASGKKIRSTLPAEGGFSFIDSWMRVAGAANVDAAYAVINHAIGGEAQKVIAATTGLGITNAKAVAELDKAMTDPWGYDALEKNFEKAPLYAGAPIEAEGDISTYQDWIKAWTDFKAG